MVTLSFIRIYLNHVTHRTNVLSFVPYGKFAPAIVLAVYAEFFRETAGPSETVLLLPIPFEKSHSRLCGFIDTYRVDNTCFLHGTYGQCSRDDTDAEFCCHARGFTQAQTVTDGTAEAVLRLVFESADGIVEHSGIICALDEFDSEPAGDFPRRNEPPPVFPVRMNVRIEEETGYIIFFPQALDHDSGAGTAADMEQKFRHSSVCHAWRNGLRVYTSRSMYAGRNGEINRKNEGDFVIMVN